MDDKEVVLKTKAYFDTLNPEIARLESGENRDAFGFCREVNQRLEEIGSSLRFSTLCCIDTESRARMTLAEAYADVFLKYLRAAYPEYEEKAKSEAEGAILKVVVETEEDFFRSLISRAKQIDQGVIPERVIMRISIDKEKS